MYAIRSYYERFKSGKLKVIGEVAPNYDGILPTDESLTKYFDLAVELDIPIGYHLFPGGRITSYNVCYTKLLRETPSHRA